MPRTALPEVLAAIGDLSREHGLSVANVFHAGDGNLHPLILYRADEPGVTDRVQELGAEILRLCIAAGGSISGEQWQASYSSPAAGLAAQADHPQRFSLRLVPRKPGSDRAS